MNAKVESLMQTLSPNTAYKLAMTGAVISALLVIWLSMGVGIIGADGDPANRMYFAVVAIGVIGALLARLRARGMLRTLFAMAIAQALIAVFAITTGLGMPWSGPAELVLLNGFFVVAFCVSALLFGRAAQ